MTDNSISPIRLQADQLIAAGFPAEAAPLYRRLVEENPDEDSHLLCLAWALCDSGERLKAVECFETLFSRELARGLVAGFALDELVRIYREEKNREALLSVCRRAAEAQPDDVGILQTLGEALLDAELPAEAVDVFTRLVKTAPDEPELWGALGGALITTGKVAKGEAAYERAARIDPAAAVIYFDRLAGALLRAGFFEKARDRWRACQTLQPDNHFYAMSLGESLVCIGELEGAFEAFGRAAARQPADAGECWRRLGDLLKKRGDADSAAEAYSRAIAAAPQNALYHLRLASCYASAGKVDLAAATLIRAKELPPTLPAR